jgi:hypothetical protein
MPKHAQLDIGIAVGVAARRRSAEQHSRDMRVGSVDRRERLDKLVPPLAGCVHARSFH